MAGNMTFRIGDRVVAVRPYTWNGRSVVDRPNEMHVTVGAKGRVSELADDSPTKVWVAWDDLPKNAPNDDTICGIDRACLDYEDASPASMEREEVERWLTT